MIGLDAAIAVIMAGEVDIIARAPTEPAPAMGEAAWPKACSCGRRFSASEFELLACIGRMFDTVDHLELRNCPCGSTIAQHVSVPR